MIEEWNIIEANPLYEISSLGRVRNKRTRTIRKTMTTTTGYEGFTTILSGRKTLFHRVHRLVAIAFIPNPERKRTINHINGDKKDNRVENLEWSTHSENSLHSHRILKKSGGVGVKHALSKLTPDDVMKIFELKSNGLSTMQIASVIGKVSRPAIRAVLSGKTWKQISLSRLTTLD